jgi:release factor glutamine methyltransferase
LDLASLTALLARNGFVAAEEEARELLAFAAATSDAARLATVASARPPAAREIDASRLSAAVERRLTGEPLAWITGSAPFCDATFVVSPGVYVPRWHTELLAEHGRKLLTDLIAARRAAAADDAAPPGAAAATAVDLCTGCGAVAAVLAQSGARVVATDVEPAAVACALANGVEAHVGDLFAPLDPGLRGTVDLVTGVVPYVPTPELHLLQRDTFTFETPTAYDGGPDGCAILRRAIAGAADFLRPGGTLLLELGGDEASLITPDLTAAGFTPPRLLRDEDGDLRAIAATLAA